MNISYVPLICEVFRNSHSLNNASVQVLWLSLRNP